MGNSGGALEERLYRRDVADVYEQLIPKREWVLFYLL